MIWLMLLACGAENTYDYTATCTVEELPAVDGTPTFAGEAGEVLAQRCATCHQDGGIAPMALTDYADASDWHSVIGAVVEAGTMPPWPPSDCGECGTFRDSRGLTDEEKAVLLAWTEAGAPQGDTGVGYVEAEPLPRLDRTDATVTMAEAYTPDDSVQDDYRCFLVDPELGGTRYLTGFELTPGDTRVVHHAILYAPTDDDAVAAAQELDDAEAGYGWTCYGGPGVDADFTAGWVPGVGAVDYPEGTGVELADRKLVLQVHYNLVNGPFPDQTSVALQLEDSVARTAVWASVSQHDLNIPPGESAWAQGRLSEVKGDIDVWGFVPHMHELGKSFQLQVHHADGSSECLIDIPDWDFHWQGIYFYEESMQLSGDDYVEIGCIYDSTSRDETVTWGDGTTDEMCLAYVYLTP